MQQRNTNAKEKEREKERDTVEAVTLVVLEEVRRETKSVEMDRRSSRGRTRRTGRQQLRK